MKTLFKGAVALLLFVVFVGCAAIRSQDPGLQLAINIGVMKAIESAPVDERPARAARIVDLADVALAMLDDQDVVVSVVYDRVVAMINWHSLDPSDEYFLRYLIAETAASVQARIEAGTVDGSKVTTVKTAVRWVRQSADTYRSMLATRSG